MTTSSLYHTQGTRSYKYQKTKREAGIEIYYLCSSAESRPCPKCRSWKTTFIETGKTRDIRGLFIGLKQVILRVALRRIKCRDCGISSHEPISFCPEPYVRYSKHVAHFVRVLRAKMSIKDVAELTGLHWETVKNIEKKWLEKKYKRVKLGEVRYLGIDEVYLGKKFKYITIVRDLISGSVLFVGKGKGRDSLKKFRKRLKRKAHQIKGVAMDMSNAYSAWVAEVLPDADIIYDHFHLVKLMNDRMNQLRRSTMNQLEEDQKKELKGKRFLLLRNEENLDTEAQEELKKIRETYADLGVASAMKEALRNIYKMAMDSTLARTAFLLWCKKARASGIGCLKRMAKTIESHLNGILGYWRHGSLTNASQEGFNNKVGWLTRQAYGYRDEEYLHLKIYDLPHLTTRRDL